MPVILFLILLEGLLSADNALVLAIMVRHLPQDQQKKALLYGLGGAFVFRFIAILFATFIIQLWWLQAAGAIYLIWVALKHFLLHSGASSVKAKPMGFWRTVVAVEIADIAFAVDSVIAAVAVVKGSEKLWVVYVGAIMGVILLRFAASIFIRLLDRFPSLDHLAYALVAWVGVKLVFMSGHNFNVDWDKKHPQQHLPIHIPEMTPMIFWGVMTVIIAVGLFISLRKPRVDAAPAEPAEAEPPSVDSPPST